PTTGAPTGNNNSGQPTGSPVGLGPTGDTSPLSQLSQALQTLASGVTGMFATGPFATGPWGPTGATGPFGFDVSPTRAGGGGGGAGAGSPISAKGMTTGEDKLFPRAATIGGTGAIGEALSRAGIAPGATMPYGGYPMGGGMGAAGAGQGQQQQQRKRPAYLDSEEHLDEAVGEDPLSVRPIIDR
ncbi:hypothetical protein ACW9HP_36395, partial [Nocardia gipuzkoensis]